MADSGKEEHRFLSRFSRLFGNASPVVSASAAAIAEPSHANGNGHSNGNGKAKLPAILSGKSIDLLPQLSGVRVEEFSDFIPLDGNGRTLETRHIGSTALAFAAYWYCATRWRAQKISEAPLMVVAEDQTDGSEEWLSDHELARLLDEPSPDYDMGELLERTSRYLDDGGECLWVKDRDRAQRTARLTPFRRGEFSVKGDGTRLFGLFTVTTSTGLRTFTAEEVCYFRDTSADGWGAARSRLDVAMGWLSLGERARQTVRDLLENSVWPSMVHIADKDWNPSEEEFKRYKEELNAYGKAGNKGKAYVLLGGGSAEAMAARIRDLVPEEVLNRVESVVAAVSGVPAIVLQFQIGMENSPWSQMAQARRMAYDDTIQPTWRRIERVLTRQLLRVEDEDTTHFIRFDKTNIAALQIDRAEATTIAVAMGKAATLNERRVIMGLEPATKEQDPDGKADEIPELSAPAMPPIAAADPAQLASVASGKSRRQHGVLVVGTALRHESRSQFEVHAATLLKHDASEIERIIAGLAAHKAAKAAPDFLARAMAGVIAYLRVSQQKWAQIVEQLFTRGAERALAVSAADLGLNYQSLHPHVVQYAKSHAGELVTDIADTTRKAVSNAIARGLADDLAVPEIARLVSQAGAFGPARAKLIAQTESTRAAEGAPVKALQALASATGRRFVKRWSGELDDRERDAHIAIEGETRPIDEPFSNGLQFPGDPDGDASETVNCRCALILSEVADE